MPDRLLHSGLKDLMKEMISLKNPPTAYICLQEILVHKMLEIFGILDLTIPRISFIGFDLSGERSHEFYSIDTINIPGHELGIRVCQVLLDMLQNRKATRDVVLDAEFKHLGSCAPPGG